MEYSGIADLRDFISNVRNKRVRLHLVADESVV